MLLKCFEDKNGLKHLSLSKNILPFLRIPFGPDIIRFTSHPHSTMLPLTRYKPKQLDLSCVNEGLNLFLGTLMNLCFAPSLLFPKCYNLSERLSITFDLEDGIFQIGRGTRSEDMIDEWDEILGCSPR